jgi:hypothetical protein
MTVRQRGGHRDGRGCNSRPQKSRDDPGQSVAIRGDQRWPWSSSSPPKWAGSVAVGFSFRGRRGMGLAPSHQVSTWATSSAGAAVRHYSTVISSLALALQRRRFDAFVQGPPRANTRWLIHMFW